MVFIKPLTPKCRKWIEKNVIYEEYQDYGGAIAMERRFFDEIFKVLESNNFKPKKDFDYF